MIQKGILDLKPYIPGKPIEEVKRELGLKEILNPKGILREGGKFEESYYTTGSPEKVEKTAKIILNNDFLRYERYN